jgi:hypothetical protein
MKMSVRKAFSVLVWISLTIGVVAQQSSSLASLREQISQLQKAVQSADTPAPVKAVDRKLLAEKRGELLSLLEMQLGALRKYQASYQSRFSAKENLRVSESIRAIEAELQTLSSSSGRDSSVALSQPERGHAVKARESLRVSVVPVTATRTPVSGNGNAAGKAQPRGNEVNRNPQNSASSEAQPVRSVKPDNTNPRPAKAAIIPVALTGVGGAAPPAPTGVIPIYWGTASGAAPCPAKVTQQTTVTFRLSGINDLMVDFNDGSKMLYRLTVERYPVSRVPPENPFVPNALPGDDGGINKDTLPRWLASIRADASRDPLISRSQAGGDSIPVGVTAEHARSIRYVPPILARLAINRNDDVFSGVLDNPVFQWIKKIDGEHTVDIPVVLEADYNYDFKFEEIWKGQVTQGGVIKASCGENDLFSLSLGPVVSTLPSRTYSHQKAPVPAGSSTTQDILSVGNKRSITLLGAALLNYHLPRMSWLPKEMGLALSAGPVYTLGGTPGVSALGLFIGPTVHFNRSIFITPGFHIGQFADFPEGFRPGDVIPNQFGDLHPVSRTTAHFAIALTYRTASFKKSGGKGADTGTTPSSGSGTQPTGKNETGGNQGTGGVTNPPDPKPTPNP